MSCRLSFEYPQEVGVGWGGYYLPNSHRSKLNSSLFVDLKLLKLVLLRCISASGNRVMTPSLKKTTSSLAHRAQLQISVEKQELIVIKTDYTCTFSTRVIIITNTHPVNSTISSTLDFNPFNTLYVHIYIHLSLNQYQMPTIHQILDNLAKL